MSFCCLNHVAYQLSLFSTSRRALNRSIVKKKVSEKWQHRCCRLEVSCSLVKSRKKDLKCQAVAYLAASVIALIPCFSKHFGRQLFGMLGRCLCGFFITRLCSVASRNDVKWASGSLRGVIKIGKHFLWWLIKQAPQWQTMWLALHKCPIPGMMQKLLSFVLGCNNDPFPEGLT